MRQRPINPAPDYTNAALVMGLVNMLWIFMVIWAWIGLPAILVLGYALDKVISRIGARRRR